MTAPTAGRPDGADLRQSLGKPGDAHLNG
jgi:hypothetical protein